MVSQTLDQIHVDIQGEKRSTKKAVRIKDMRSKTPTLGVNRVKEKYLKWLLTQYQPRVEQPENKETEMIKLYLTKRVGQMV